MIFESLTLLGSRPVHEEAVRQMYRCNSDKHINDDSKRCNTAQKAEKQPDTTEEFGSNREKGEKRRNAQLAEGLHCCRKARPSKPAKHFLSAVSEENDAQYEP